MDNSDQSDLLFRETQRFQPRWLWVLAIAAAVIDWYWAWHRQWRVHPGTDAIFAIFLAVVGVGAPIFLLFYRQTTEVRSCGIYLKRGPFPRASDVIRFSEFYRYQPRNCSPIYAAGGWGIVEGWQGRSYNMGGGQGLELCLAGGKRVLIGSQKMRQLLDALHSQCRVRMQPQRR
jgi:hypothetical protein